jgi:hypothetical protein
MRDELKITFPAADPYAEVLNNFYFQQYPVPLLRTSEAMLEAVTTELIGSGQYRYGPRPSPESLVEIRRVIRSHIADGDPIPVLVPFGGMKAEPLNSVDVAELSALKILECLNARVATYYSPGLDVRIRIEDTGAYWLFRDQKVDSLIDRYSEDFAKLTRIIGAAYATPVREATLMNREEYFTRSTTASARIMDYLDVTENRPTDGLAEYEALQHIKNIGWTGRIPVEQREYYRSRYRRLYPDRSPAEHNKMLADYLAGALTRYQMGGRGEAPGWTRGFINLSFVPPVPGAPPSLVSTNLYYRVVPQRFSRDHIAPWRGKGYLRVANNVATPAIASWRAEATYNPFMVEFSGGGETVRVQSDYLVND